MHESQLQDLQSHNEKALKEIESLVQSKLQLKQSTDETIAELRAECENYKEQIMQWSDAYQEQGQQLVDMTDQYMSSSQEVEQLHDRVTELDLQLTQMHEESDA